MGSCMCFLRNPPPRVSVLPIPLLIFSCNYWGFGFFSIFLTSSALILTNLLITSSKNKEQEALVNPVSQEHSSGSRVQGSVPMECQASERFDQSSTSEDSESDNVDHSPDWSDGYISDEESLFEIALSSGHFAGDHNKEEAKFLNTKLPDLLQLEQSLKELLAEISEEDNMIEIDLSMGSIKCSRFEIEA